MPVLNTTVQVTRDVRAGGTIRVQAPAGSKVRMGATSLTVPAPGTVELAAPAAPGDVRIRVTRPDGRTLSFEVKVR